MRLFLRGLLIAVVWLVLIVGGLELLLRVTAPNLPGQVGVVARTITTGQPYSESWQPAWQQNRDHYYALRPGVQDELQYGSATVSFQLTTHKLWDDGLPPDEGIGFRNPPVDYRVDAVVVGDSFSFCFNEIGDCWVNLLADRTGLGLVNLGTPVTGSLSHGKMLADFGAPFEPPLVIWQFFGNDFNDDYGLLSWRGDIDPIGEVVQETSATDSQGSWLSQNLVTVGVLELLLTGQWGSTPESDLPYVPQYTATYGDGEVLQFGKLYERQAMDMTRPANQFGFEQSRMAFTEAQTLVDSWDGTLVFVIIPTREEVYDFITEPIMGSAELDKQRSARQAMLATCEDLNLTCLDLFEPFHERAQNDEALYYSDDMHLNAAGNAALAEIVHGWLADTGALPTP